METTKKVGDSDPSCPQGHPSVSAQQLGGGLAESQGQWISSGSMFFKQGLSLFTEAAIERARGSAAQAQAPRSIQQSLEDLTEVSSQAGCKQDYLDALRLFSTSQFTSAIGGIHAHGIMENETLTFPVHKGSDTTSNTTQKRSYRSRLQELVAGQSKTPAKVLVGCGRGSCSQEPPLGFRKSRWLPGFPPGEDSAVDQEPLPATARDQDQDKGPDLTQPPSAPTQADTPAPEETPSVAVNPYTSDLDHMTNTITISQAPRSQDFQIVSCDSHWAVFMDSSKAVRVSQDNSYPQEEPPPPLPSQGEQVQGSHLDTTREPVKDNRSQELPMEPEKPAKEVDPATPISPMPWSDDSGSPEMERSGQKVGSSQPEPQPLTPGVNTYSSMQLSGLQHPVQHPGKAMQVPASSDPSGLLQDAVEDQVLVFDMATGNTRMGLLCHDPMGSRAVLVGLVPNHPAKDTAEKVLPDQPVPLPAFPKDNYSNFWPISPRKVPSTSSNSYPEVALVHQKSTFNLEEKDAPQAESPQRVRMFRAPVPVEVPLQFGERLQEPDWSKPDADRNEANRTIWMLDFPKTQNPPVAPTKWMSSERPPEPATSAQIKEDRRSHEQKEGVTALPDNPRAEGAGPAPVAYPPPVELHPHAEKSLLATQPPPNNQLPAVKQPPFTNQSCFLRLSPPPGTPLEGQRKLTEESPLPQEPSGPHKPVLSKAPYTSGESVWTPALHQESKLMEPPDHDGVLRVTPTSEEARVHLNREKGTLNGLQNSKPDRVFWQPGDSATVPKKSLSLFTLTTPGPGCKVLPMAMVGTDSPGSRFKLTAEDVTHSSMVAQLGLLRGTCYELMSPATVLPVHTPVLCPQPASPYMAAVVIDTGSGFTKCGLAGEDHVLSVVSSRIQLLHQSVHGQPRYVVPENQKGSFSVLNRGVVSDWDALEVLWQHLFYCRLGMRPEELAVLVADSPISPRTNREKVAEILFERFHVPAMQTVHQALLALYAYGRTTGLVLGSGHGTSYVAPILTGDLAPMDTYRLDVAGCDLTEYLAQLLVAGGQSLPRADLVNQIKEACCYVAMDMAAEWTHTERQTQVDFVLPDKQVIKVGSERFCCTEALFQPHLLGLNQPGLPQLALLSISKLEAKQQEQLLANVVLEGGTTLVRGFPERVRQELSPRATVLASPHRAVAAWLGGSIMASREAFQSLWLSRREYEEEGSWAIYKYQL